MKKLLALMLLVSAVVMVGCGSSEPAPEDAGKAVKGAKNPNTGGEDGSGGAPVTPQ